ncbi:MAG: hypothetical protein GVY32_12670 [Gammaproteobacteria bacterium]|jgi:hypothetical protein|nr:hypothetical protein [Gammaproteobacteria bacterium]
MMPKGSYSVDSLLEFLKYAGMEGLVNPASARSRRNAVEQLAAELTEEERADLRKVDVDDLASRFHKLEESSLRLEALELYAERFRLALADFLAWSENPAAFDTVGSERLRAIPRGPSGRSGIGPDQEVAERIALESTENPSNVVPVALAENRTVHIAGLPLDLSAAEAEKICRIVRAFAAEPGDGEDGQ